MEEIYDLIYIIYNSEENLENKTTFINEILKGNINIKKNTLQYECIKYLSKNTDFNNKNFNIDIPDIFIHDILLYRLILIIEKIYFVNYIIDNNKKINKRISENTKMLEFEKDKINFKMNYNSIDFILNNIYQLNIYVNSLPQSIIKNVFLDTVENYYTFI